MKSRKTFLICDAVNLNESSQRPVVRYFDGGYRMKRSGVFYVDDIDIDINMERVVC